MREIKTNEIYRHFKNKLYYVLDIAEHTKTGEKIHPRSAKALCAENAEWEGKKKVFWLTDDFCKYKGIDKINGLMFRYIYPMDRNAKRILEKTYPKIKNPKDEDLLFERRVKNGVFERIQQPNFNMRVFNHNFQKGMEVKEDDRT